MHIAEVLGYLQDEVRILREEQENLNKVSKKKELNSDDISNLLKKIPEFEKRKSKILIHLDLA